MQNKNKLLLKKRKTLQQSGVFDIGIRDAAGKAIPRGTHTAAVKPSDLLHGPDTTSLFKQSSNELNLNFANRKDSTSDRKISRFEIYNPRRWRSHAAALLLASSS